MSAESTLAAAMIKKLYEVLDICDGLRKLNQEVLKSPYYEAEDQVLKALDWLESE